MMINEMVEDSEKYGLSINSSKNDIVLRKISRKFKLKINGEKFEQGGHVAYIYSAIILNENCTTSIKEIKSHIKQARGTCL